MDSDVPCVIAYLGVTCCYNYKCKCGFCSTLGALKTSVQDGGAPALTEADAALEGPVKAIEAVEIVDRQ